MTTFSGEEQTSNNFSKEALDSLDEPEPLRSEGQYIPPVGQSAVRFVTEQPAPWDPQQVPEEAWQKFTQTVPMKRIVEKRYPY